MHAAGLQMNLRARTQCGTQRICKHRAAIRVDAPHFSDMPREITLFDKPCQRRLEQTRTLVLHSISGFNEPGYLLLRHHQIR